MEDFTTLRFERDGAVAVIAINRPQAGNAIDVTMSRELLHAAIACDRDDSVRAVLLRSEGKLFSAGGDIGAFVGAGDKMPDLISEETAYLHAAVARLARMDKPLVVAVQGFAAGAGFSLAMLGDIVMAGKAAQFTLAYTAIGLTPDGGASWLLPRLVGYRKAQEMILLNRRFGAQEALDIGLLTQVVEDEDLLTRALEIAHQLAAGPTRAFGRCRDLMLGCFGETLETHLEREARGIVASAGERDGKEGVRAFLAKAKPEFTG
ncbi:2-(1,2-epoxy-1,2-dihydrophenyl)acetyl-CoA isomerase [Sphingobium faniae]|nr:2-(1,2-epoxy-1,2-dihydrophenyl)acetyl-CoA isomerase [Sphingobium faniae]